MPSCGRSPKSSEPSASRSTSRSRRARPLLRRRRRAAARPRPRPRRRRLELAPDRPGARRAAARDRPRAARSRRLAGARRSGAERSTPSPRRFSPSSRRRTRCRRRWIGHSLGGLVGLRAAAHRPGRRDRHRARRGRRDLVGDPARRAGRDSCSARSSPGRLSGRTGAASRALAAGADAGVRLVGGRRSGGLRCRDGGGVPLGRRRSTPTRLTPARALVGDRSAARPRSRRLPAACASGARPTTGCRCRTAWTTPAGLRAPLRVIADCGHLLIGERPDAVLAAVAGFSIAR